MAHIGQSDKSVTHHQRRQARATLYFSYPFKPQGDQSRWYNPSKIEREQSQTLQIKQPQYFGIGNHGGDD